MVVVAVTPPGRFPSNPDSALHPTTVPVRSTTVIVPDPGFMDSRINWRGACIQKQRTGRTGTERSCVTYSEFHSGGGAGNKKLWCCSVRACGITCSDATFPAAGAASPAGSPSTASSSRLQVLPSLAAVVSSRVPVRRYHCLSGKPGVVSVSSGIIHRGSSTGSRREGSHGRALFECAIQLPNRFTLLTLNRITDRPPHAHFRTARRGVYLKLQIRFYRYKGSASVS